MQPGAQKIWPAAVLALVLTAAQGAAQTTADFFNPNVLHEIRLNINPADWQALRANYQQNTYYTCDFGWRYQGRDVTSTDVAIRSRGRDSRSPVKPSLRVDFNRNDPKQEFLGLKSLVLRNNSQDASQLHNRLAILSFRLMGLPASREAHARLYVNDQYIGLYLMVEEVKKELLKFNFGENDGQLWDYNWVRGEPYHFDYLGPDPGLYIPKFFSPETHENNPDSATLIEMIRIMNQASDADFPSAIGEYLDLRRVMAHVAVEIFVGDPDDVLENNLFLYRFERRKLFQWVPWDKDGAFKSFPSIWRERTNILIRRALGLPQFRTAYLQALARLSVLAGGAGGWLEQEIQREYEQIRAAALEDPNKLCLSSQGTLKPCSNEEFEAEVQNLLQYARARSEAVRGELADAGFELRVVDAASFVPGPVAPGSLISIFGERLATSTAQASALPLPNTLGGASVQINGVDAPLLFVSPGQLNLQVPWTLPPGAASIVVRVDGTARDPISATVAPASPGIFVVVHADGRPVSSENPAVGGEVLIVYANGLGAVAGNVLTGQASPGNPPATTTQAPGVTISGVPAQVEFSGLTPGLVGLYQVNVRAPTNLPTGGVTPLLVSIGGQVALPAFLATR